MSEQTLNRWRALVIAAAPPVFLVGVVIHPYIADWTDTAGIAGAIEAEASRMALASAILGFSMGVTLLAFFAIRQFLRAAANENTWSAIAVALATLGGALVATFTGAFLALAFAAQAGQAVLPIMSAGEGWVPLQIGGFVVFALGSVAMAVAIYRSRVLSTGLTWVVAAALIIGAVGSQLPWGFGYYVAGAASFFAAWPLAYAVWGARGAPA